jgi:hypothetical protein
MSCSGAKGGQGSGVCVVGRQRVPVAHPCRGEGGIQRQRFPASKASSLSDMHHSHRVCTSSNARVQSTHTHTHTHAHTCTRALWSAKRMNAPVVGDSGSVVVDDEIVRAYSEPGRGGDRACAEQRCGERCSELVGNGEEVRPPPQLCQGRHMHQQQRRIIWVPCHHPVHQRTNTVRVCLRERYRERQTETETERVCAYVCVCVCVCVRVCVCVCVCV